MLIPGNQSVFWRRALPLFDAYFTTKSFGVAELTAMGCRRAIFVGNAFDAETHKPVTLTAERKLLRPKRNRNGANR